MELNAYQTAAQNTRNKELSEREEILNYALGLGECGEAQNKIKKLMFHGHDESEIVPEIIDELGDILWYIATLSKLFGYTLENVASINLEKLRNRYPEGFNPDGSINRR